MRRLALLMTVVLAVSACGGGRARHDVATPARGAMPTSSSAAMTPSSTSTRPPSTTSTTTTTTFAQTTTPRRFELPAILRPDGIATVDFGTEAQEAMVVLAELLGPPSEVRDEGPQDSYWSVEQVRFVTWDGLGLQLVFTDWGGDHTQPVASPLHLADWEVFGPGLTTTEGLSWGTSVSDLRARYPDVRFGIDEFAPTFSIEGPAGRIIGSFTDWPYEEFARALIAALNEHGAEIDPDDLDRATGQAMVDFMEREGMHDAGDVLAALGLPPDDVLTGWMHAGTGPLCC